MLTGPPPKFHETRDILGFLSPSGIGRRSKRLRRLRSGAKASQGDELLSRDASGLAGDYASLAKEVLEAIAVVETSRQPIGA